MAGTATTVRETIREMPPGALFSESDVNVPGSRGTTVRRLLQRMCDSGEIHRAVRGIYYKPCGIGLFGIEDIPLVRDVAEAIARARGWHIVPTGNTALNALGLSTQVPGHTQYVSTGPDAAYRYQGISIEFKHTQCLRDVIGMSPATLLVIQALKTLRKERIDEEVLHQVASRMTKEQTFLAVKETYAVTEWVRDAIRRIDSIKSSQGKKKVSET